MTQDELIAVIAQRFESGARINIQMIAAELGVHRFDVLDAYDTYAQRLGYDPLTYRTEVSLERMRALSRG